jgi:hypothetical protein
MDEEPPGWLEARLRSGHVLILLDGLDEVQHGRRTDVSKWVQSQMRAGDNRECRFVLTSRPGGYVTAPLGEATVLEIQPFSRGQIEQFIEGWYLENEIVASGPEKSRESVRRRAAQEADDLRHRLRDNPNIQDLTVNPLLLTMVCMVHRYHGALPGTRAQLYSEICQVLLERWRQAKDIVDEFTGEQKLAVMRPLAHEFMSKELRELPQEQIVKFIAGPLEYIGYLRAGDTHAADRFLRSIQTTSGLLLEKEAGVWSFAHKTFQEYLASEYWLRNKESLPNWPAIVAQDWWREALLLYAARADASDLVQAALNAESPPSWALAFQCLSEAHSLHPDIRSRAESTLRVALHSDDPVIFYPAARSMHYLRQTQVRAMGDKVEQRTALVTQAEYQLFLGSFDKFEQESMRPPHWRRSWFEGDPEAPILGIWPWQAERFATFAAKGAFSTDWRLPHPEESTQISTNGDSAPYWCADGQLAKEEPRRQKGNSHSDEALPSGLNIETHLDIQCLHAIATALDTALWVAPDQAFDLAFALARAINVAVTRTFCGDVQRAHDLAAMASFNGEFVHRVTRALEADPQCKYLLSLSERAIPVSTLLDPSTSISFWGRKRQRKAFPSVEMERPLVIANREKLIACGRDLYHEARRKVQDGFRQLTVLCYDWNDSNQSWNNYASFILQMAIPYLTDRHLAQASQLESTLRLIRDRESGAARPVEGIQLVRDRYTRWR